jgi:hypothetical protein
LLSLIPSIFASPLFGPAFSIVADTPSPSSTRLTDPVVVVQFPAVSHEVIVIGFTPPLSGLVTVQL